MRLCVHAAPQCVIAACTCCVYTQHVFCCCPHAEQPGHAYSQEPWLIALLLCQAALLAAIILFRQNQTFTAAVFAGIGKLVAA